MRRIVVVVLVLAAVAIAVYGLVRDFWTGAGTIVGVAIGASVTYLVQQKASAKSSRPWWRGRSRQADAER